MRGASAAGVQLSFPLPTEEPKLLSLMLLLQGASSLQCAQAKPWVLCIQGRPADVLSANLTKLLERVYADADAAHGDEASIPISVMFVYVGSDECRRLCDGRAHGWVPFVAATRFPSMIAYTVQGWTWHSLASCRPRSAGCCT